MPIYDDELMTYREAGQRLGVHPDSIMRRARREGWERVEGNANTDPVRVRVPAAVLAEHASETMDEPRSLSLDRARRAPRIFTDVVATLGAALERQELANKGLQADLDTARAETARSQIDITRADTLRLAAEKGAEDLARRLEREETERHILQDQVDAVRVELSDAEDYAAELQAGLDALRLAAEKDAEDLRRRLEREETERRVLQDQTDALRIELSAAEAHTADLQARFDALEMKRQADLDAALETARAEIDLARFDTGKAEALRLAAEKSAEDLARLLEREQAERHSLQDQTNIVRGELSVAEARAAELQARFDALEMKRQADLDAAVDAALETVRDAALETARAEIDLARIDTAKADVLRLAAEKGAEDLGRRLEREETERRVLQDQTDALRIELSAAEAHAAELQARFDALETRPRADLDAELEAALEAARAETAQAQLDTGKAEALRLAAEKGAEDLARRLERKEAERHALQDQTDAVRVELSAAETRAAELQAKVGALETKRQASLPDKEHTLWQQHAAHRIRELEHQLEAAKVAARGRGEPGTPNRRKRWWWPVLPARRG